MTRLPDTPEAAAETSRLFKERHCQCENCKHTRKHGGYMVCMTKLDRAMRHDDKPAGPPNEAIRGPAIMIFMVAPGIMFLGLLAVCLT